MKGSLKTEYDYLSLLKETRYEAKFVFFIVCLKTSAFLFYTAAKYTKPRAC